MAFFRRWLLHLTLNIAFFQGPPLGVSFSLFAIFKINQKEPQSQGCGLSASPFCSKCQGCKANIVPCASPRVAASMAGRMHRDDCASPFICEGEIARMHVHCGYLVDPSWLVLSCSFFFRFLGHSSWTQDRFGKVLNHQIVHDIPSFCRLLLLGKKFNLSQLTNLTFLGILSTNWGYIWMLCGTWQSHCLGSTRKIARSWSSGRLIARTPSSNASRASPTWVSWRPSEMPLRLSYKILIISPPRTCWFWAAVEVFPPLEQLCSMRESSYMPWRNTLRLMACRMPML